MADQLHNDNEARYKQRMPEVGKMLHSRYKKSCNRNLLLNRLPIIKWLPNYKLSFLFEDFLAGITVGLTAIPQGIAYGVVAGLPPQYGLYSSFVGCFVYMLFGSCKDVTIGPTAIMALMIQRYVTASPDYAVLVAFLSGCIILLCGCLNLGFLVRFISTPVVNGFTTAAAITIGCGQIKSILGISGNSNEFVDAWINVFKKISETRLWDTVLGVLTIVALILFKRLKNVNNRWKPICRYLSLSRNAIAVIFGIVLAYFLAENSIQPFLLMGKVESGYPPFQAPPFSTVVNNQTVEFGGMVSELGTSLIALPLVAILESIAIAKAFSKGRLVDATQEMVALGLCNILGSFFSSMPTTGSFTRTAVNNASGVRTTLGGIFTGGLVLLALGFLTSTFYYIPKCTLAAVIIAAMISMVEYEVAIEIWKIRRIDLLPYIVTILVSLFASLEVGICAGVLVNVAFILYNATWPEMDTKLERINNLDVLVICPKESLAFSSAENIKTRVMKAAVNNECSLVVIDGYFIQHIDFTVAKNLHMMAEEIKVIQREIVFWRWKDQPTGVAWRLSRSFGDLFRQADCIYTLVDDIQCEKSGGTIIC